MPRGNTHGWRAPRTGVFGSKAYVDMFCWTALILAVCLPGAWLLKKAVNKERIAVH